MPVTPPPSFTLCAGQSCPAPIHHKIPEDRERHEWTIPHDQGKCKSPCSCRIFRREGAKGSWEFAFPNEKGHIPYDEDSKYQYETACVTPVLPANAATGAAYSLCAASGVAGCKQFPDKVGDDIRCPVAETPCSTGCNCVMFRLKRDDAGAKWEKAGDAGEKVSPDHEKYYYECMCVK